jgi:hypothetical protein
MSRLTNHVQQYISNIAAIPADTLNKSQMHCLPSTISVLFVIQTEVLKREECVWPELEEENKDTLSKLTNSYTLYH